MASVERGLHLGYRRLREGAGPWIARRYVGAQRYDEQAIGIADDLSDADGVRVLSYWQAVDLARGTSAKEVAARTYTVADAVTDYLEYLTREKKSGYTFGCRMAAHVVPVLGHIEVADLSATVLRKWLAELAAQPPRVRAPRGSEPRYREIGDDSEAIRKRKASANQCLVVLKAALNRAFEEELVPSDNAWRKVRPYQNVDVARGRYLNLGEAKRLLNACDPDFRNLLRAALETGARYGELTRLKVEDYNPDVGTVAIRESKTSTPRHVVLTADGDAFFRQVCAGRTGGMVVKHYGHLAPSYIADSIRAGAPRFGKVASNVKAMR